MSDRKYRQHGYQDSGDSKPAARGPKPKPQETTFGPRPLNMPGARRVSRCAQCGALLDGVCERMEQLRNRMTVYILSADTFGSASELALGLNVGFHRVTCGGEKRRLVERLGADRCVAIGNGANDAEMLAAAKLGIAVLGAEGASSAALRNADVCFRCVHEAFDALLQPAVLTATLRP